MPNNKFALVLALLCASIASFLIYKVIKESSKPKMAVIPKTNVVVAKVIIPARSIVTVEQIELKAVPLEALSKDTAQKIEDVVGSITKSEILDGESINLNRLVRKGESIGLSFVIPQGMRAITIAMNEVIGVAGFIKAGEKVDIVGIVQSKTENTSIAWTVLQAVEVLAVSQDMGTPANDPKNNNNTTSKVNEAKVGTSVTLAVTPLQAEKVALAEEKGSLRLTLRPVLKEKDLIIPPIRENNLVTGESSHKSTTIRNTSVNIEPVKQRIEIISGANTQILTVY
jgi:pilus assembly protein CpaB